MKLLSIALSMFVSASALAAKPASSKNVVAAAAACFPSCLEDLKAPCAPSGACTKNEPATQTDTSISYYCFANLVKIAETAYSETRAKPDGSICYSVDSMPDVTGTKYQYTWKNAAGAVVATESFDYADMGGRYHTVVCGGVTTVVDTSSAQCMAEQAQQIPDISGCATNAACTLSAGTAGAGGAPGTGGAGGSVGGMGGTAPAAGGTPGQGGSSASTGGAGGAPGCAADQTMCGGVCTNLMIDAAHCGMCGTVCDSGYTCMQGACTRVIPCNKSTERLCGGSCVDIETDSKNCGGCGVACPDGTFCSTSVVSGSGTPVYSCLTSCAAGTLMCGGDCKPPRDERNCGSCTTACGPTEVCCSKALTGTICSDAASSTAGPFACQPCPAGYTTCNGICAALYGDPGNCGQCGVVCQFGCSQGKCVSDPAKSTSGSCAVGAVSPRGTLYGLGGVGLVLASLFMRRRRGR